MVVTTDGTIAGAVAWFECRVVDFPLSSPDCAVLEAATIRLIRNELLAGGLATADEIDEHLRHVDSDPGQFATSAMVTAWGRKPEEGETREGV